MDRRKYLDADEVKRLRTVSQAAHVLALQKGKPKPTVRWMLVDLALSTGLRVSELARIKTCHVDLKRGILTVYRSKKRKLVPESLNIDTGLVAHLREYLDWRTLAGIENENLLVGERGALKAQGLELIWKRAVAEAGLPAEYTIHKARHTLAVHLLKKTRNLRQVQRQLGHSSPIVTANTYADVTDEDMKAGLEGLYT